MRNRKRRRIRIAAVRLPAVFKGIGMLLLLFIFLRIIISLGAEAAAEGMLGELVQKDGIAGQILFFELGNYTDGSDKTQNIDLSAVLSESSLLRANTGSVAEVSETAEAEVSSAPADEDSDSLNDPEPFETDGAGSTADSDSGNCERRRLQAAIRRSMSARRAFI